MTRPKKETKLQHALFTILLMAVFMFLCLVVLRSDILIPLIFGCFIAGCVSMYLGYSWDEVLDGMIKGILPSLEAILILLMIGMLVGAWIASGTVPAILYYGLKIVTPVTFLPSCMVLCLIVAFMIGSWGTVGTMGIAFMGMGLALGLPAPAVAGAVISGSYMGEVISPLADVPNLAGGVVGENIFTLMRRVLPPAILAGLLAVILYVVLGFRLSASIDPTAIAENLTSLSDALKTQFNITPLALLPLVFMVACMLLKVPSMPAMLLGAAAGMLQAVIMQHTPVSDLFAYVTSGYVSATGNEMADTLLTSGGIQSMLDVVSVILIAMAFGGIMSVSGQMNALVKPILSHLRSNAALRSVTVITCILVNMILPDQYLGVTMPGQMYGDEYARRGLPPRELGSALLGGGAVTSPLVPWNSCGFYCMSILAISPTAYAPYAFFRLILPVVTIVGGFIKSQGDAPV